MEWEKSKNCIYNFAKSKKEGGLNLVNLKNRDKALKATWPQILAKEKDYAQLVYAIMRCSVIGEDIWRCSIAQEDVEKMKFTNQFWKDVLKSWCEYNYYTGRRIENQYIWYNQKIRIGGRVVMWNDVYKRGLKYVYQLFQNKRYKSYDEVWYQYGLTKLRYNSLKAAMPIDWKEYFQTKDLIEFLPIPPHNYDRVIIQGSKSLSREVHGFLADDAMIIHNKYIKWRQELGIGIGETLGEFTAHHMDIYKVTNIAKYRSFQYRLLQQGLVTNIHLKKWGIKQSDQCSFCNNDKEGILHLIYYCPVVQELWAQMVQWIKEQFGIQEVLITVDTVVLNRIVENPRSVANFICLLVKHYLYAQKCLQKEPSIHQVKDKILQVERIEKYIAVKNNKILVHNTKWCYPNANTDMQSANEFILSYLDDVQSD